MAGTARKDDEYKDGTTADATPGPSTRGEYSPRPLAPSRTGLSSCVDELDLAASAGRSVAEAEPIRVKQAWLLNTMSVGVDDEESAREDESSQLLKGRRRRRCMISSWRCRTLPEEIQRPCSTA